MQAEKQQKQKILLEKQMKTKEMLQGLNLHFANQSTYLLLDSKLARTYKNYIKHLPGNIRIPKKADPKQSLRSLIADLDPTEYQDREINFQPFSDEQLSSSFSLMPGGLPEELKAKRKKRNVKRTPEEKKRKLEKKEKRAAKRQKTN